MNLDTSTQISVLDKYQISKAKKSFSYGRDLFQYWNSSKITFLAMIMDKPDFYKFLVETKIINIDHVSCNKCKGKMVYRLNKAKTDGIVWACNNKIGTGIYARTCNSTRSVRTNSWFFKSKLSISEVLLYTYIWWSKIPQIHAKKEFGFSSRTVVDWANFCREVAIDAVFKHSEKIGGPGSVVEIDESKFGKRKFPIIKFILYHAVYLFNRIVAP